MTSPRRLISTGRRLPLTNIARITVVGMLLLGHISHSQHVYSDSFSANDEYDFTILDPNTIFGSPFGGFSRASRSRLASLPLHFPALPNSSPKMEDENYYEVRDGQGRLFVCRVYHEDELDPSTLPGSMFDEAVEKEPSSSPRDNVDHKESSRLNGKIPVSSSDIEMPVSDGDGISHEREASELKTDSSNLDKKRDTDPSLLTAKERLEHEISKLEGVCAQIHKGWWSYEWCHNDIVTQFHIHVENLAGKESSTSLSVQDVTNIGKYSSRSTELFDDPSDVVDGMRRMGRVVEKFEDGEVCPDTETPRQIEVELQCCSRKKMKQMKGGVLYEGKQVTSNIASIFSLKEIETCVYRATVCTPLLCENAAEVFGDEMFGLAPEKGPKLQQERQSPPRKENESIRETIHRTLNNVCLVSGSGGWWVYEFCQRHARQYHESTYTDTSSGMLTKVTDTQYILGVYSATEVEDFPNEEEANHVVNIADGTDGSRSRQRSRSRSSKGGNGSYFLQEYRHGDVCDDSDVTEAAIKAGNVGTGGIERSISIRYYCGPDLELVRVSEDSTCHYVAEITIPDLCYHPLFQAPVQKKQVVKCLPAKDDLFY